MNPANLTFLIVTAILLIALPRRLAAIPLLLAAAYSTRVPVLVLGPANLSVLRVLVLVGMLRVLMRSERLVKGINAIDWLLFAWATLLIFNSAFHTSDAWTYRIGSAMEQLGVYVLCRIFLQELDEVRQLFKILCVLLVPLAILLLLEKYTNFNYFAVMGSAAPSAIRDGKIRATGPFGHAILAGTVGAACLPMALIVWKRHRVSAVIGLLAGVGILYAATSSSPFMVVAFTGFGLLIWYVRNLLALIRWGTVAAIIVLDIIMEDPVYFLMARIDITGGSTGWFRAALIRSAIEHLDEWWLAGTDYTRHWMSSGIPANDRHVDIVNHYLSMGVTGGLPLLGLFLVLLWAAFREVGKSLDHEGESSERAFVIWTLGAMLFGQVIGFIAISPYDQSVTLYYLVLASIGAVRAPRAATKALHSESPRWKPRGLVAAVPAVTIGQQAAPGFARHAERVRNRGKSADPSEAGVNRVRHDRRSPTFRAVPKAHAHERG